MRRILVLLLVLLVLAGCGGTDRTETVQVLNLTDAPLTDRQIRQLQELALEEAASYQDLISQIGPSDTVNFSMTDPQIAQVAARLAEQGKTVVDSENSINMINPDPARTFGRVVQTGTDGSVVLYRVYADGGFARSEFTQEAGRASLVNVRVTWDNSLTPQIVSISKRDLTELTYTDKGYLIYRTRELDSVAGAPGYVPYQMIRVEPLDDTCRQLCRTYIRPAGYANHNLFLTDWSRDDLDDLVWNDVFPVCYFLDTGILLTGHTTGGYEFANGVGLLIPAADYTAHIRRYFAVEESALLADSDLDQASGCYPVRIFTSTDMDAALPVPEVVDLQENSDGSLTMTVEALNAAYGTDCAFAHRVTVLPRDDGGWYYVGNTMIPGENDRLPAYERE